MSVFVFEIGGGVGVGVWGRDGGGGGGGGACPLGASVIYHSIYLFILIMGFV